MWVILSFNINLSCLLCTCYFSKGGKFLILTQSRDEMAGEDVSEKELVGVEEIGFPG